MSDEGPSKRQRISQACESCRRRKSKCDGAQPSCQICISHNRACVYENASRKRGLQVGYVRGVELLLGMLIRDLSGSERSLRVLLRSPNCAFPNAGYVEEAANRWHASKLHDDLKNLLNITEGASTPNRLSPIESEEEHIQADAQTNLSQDLTGHGESTMPQMQAPSHSTSAIAYPAWPTNTLELIDTYFQSIHCWFPLVERRDILSIFHSTESFSRLSTRDKGRRACLRSIIALTIASQTHPDAGPQSGGNQDEMLLNPEDSLSKPLDMLEHSFDIGHIQAALLQVLLQIAWSQFDAAWISVAPIARMIQVYATNSFRPDARLPHVIRGCYILDVFLSTITGRPSGLRFESWPSTVLDEDALEEWEGWDTGSAEYKRPPLRSLSILNMITQLMQILQDILTTSKEVQTALGDLLHWSTNLPTYCTFALQPSTPSVLHLHLFHKFAMAAVVRMGRHNVSGTIIKDIGNTTAKATERLIEFIGYRSPLLKAITEESAACLLAWDPKSANSEVQDLIKRLQVTQKLFVSGWCLPQTYVTSHPVTTGSASVSHQPSIHFSTTNTSSANMMPFRATSTQLIEPFQLQNHPSTKLYNSTEVDRYAESNNQLLDVDNLDFNPDPNMLVKHSFDTLLQDVFIPAVDEGLADDEDFAQNLGFLSDDLHQEFLAALASDGHS